MNMNMYLKFGIMLWIMSKSLFKCTSFKLGYHARYNKS